MKRLVGIVVLSSLIAISSCKKPPDASSVEQAGDDSSANLGAYEDDLNATDSAQTNDSVDLAAANEIDGESDSSNSANGIPFIRKAANYTVGRAYLHGIFLNQSSPYAKGVVLLHKGSGKNRMFCKYFVKNLGASDKLSIYVPSTKVIPTYWLLTQDPGTIDETNCDDLLSHYDYDQAAALMAWIGRSDRKGPIIAAVDNSNGLMMVDFTKANSKDTSNIIANWFASAASSNGDKVIKSVTFWNHVVDALCDISGANLSDLPSTTPDPKKIASYANLVNNFQPIKLVEMAGIVVGRTFDAIACPKAPPSAPAIAKT